MVNLCDFIFLTEKETRNGRYNRRKASEKYNKITKR